MKITSAVDRWLLKGLILCLCVLALSWSWYAIATVDKGRYYLKKITTGAVYMLDTKTGTVYLGNSLEGPPVIREEYSLSDIEGTTKDESQDEE